ncbi:hypothetical protein [uncultured Clostridium sp.]|nr:hypothetical protein [uncultured Clostridium sp.]
MIGEIVTVIVDRKMGVKFTIREIEKQVRFQEKYFDYEVLM